MLNYYFNSASISLIVGSEPWNIKYYFGRFVHNLWTFFRGRASKKFYSLIPECVCA